jgi:hypothetical protein
MLIVGLRAAVNRPLGALGGYIDLVDHGLRPNRRGFSAFVLLGIVLGGALLANVAGAFSPTWFFGAGWSVPGTCPRPVAAMIGEGKLAGLIVRAGLLAGVAAQPALVRKRGAERSRVELSGAVGL